MLLDLLFFGVLPLVICILGNVITHFWLNSDPPWWWNEDYWDDEESDFERRADDFKGQLDDEHTEID